MSAIFQHLKAEVKGRQAKPEGPDGKPPPVSLLAAGTAPLHRRGHDPRHSPPWQAVAPGLAWRARRLCSPRARRFRSAGSGTALITVEITASASLCVLGLLAS